MKFSFTKMYLLLSLLSITTFSIKSQDYESGNTFGDSFMHMAASTARNAAVFGFLNTLNEHKYITLYASLGTILFLGEIQRESPKFFNALTKIVTIPTTIVRKKLERIFCNGESLSWNDILMMKNRINNIFSPLTKQSTVVDLSREKRFKIMNKDGSEEQVKDTQWIQARNHIQLEFKFLCMILNQHLNYYEPQSSQCLQSAGQACVHITLQKESAIIFSIKNIITYLEEAHTYFGTVETLEELDKEHLKSISTNISDTFDHLATLINVETAAARSSIGKLPLKDQMSAPRSYGHGGYGQV